MQCPGCGFQNPDGMRFCGKCGASTGVTCARCRFENPPGFEFCGKCGAPLASTQRADNPLRVLDPHSYTPNYLAEKILTSRSALEGERKQVTVLFADVKGSMDLAAQLDPEDWHAILEGFFGVLSDGVHRFEGTINQYTGDGVMALFGAPIAHEDHASRACYAALALKSELRRYAEEVKRARGLSFAVRIGIHSGEVVVGKIGDDLRMDYTAQGETVGLAARLEQLADPGSVYVSERTAALVRGYFALRDLGTFTVKGLSAPARIYELEGAGRLRTRIEVAEARGFSRFVGREREIEILESALERALGGNGQALGIVAEPGAGKSRLCLEFVAGCRKHGLYVNEGHCPPHGKVVPYLPILELWRAYFGIGEKDSDEEVRRKVAGTLLLLDESFRDSLPPLFEFLGVPDPDDPAARIDPEAKQRQLLSFLRRLTQKLSEREPFVILIDDLHWVDRASDVFVAEFAEAIEGRRVLFLVNFRPEYEAGWMRNTYYQQISLSPLSSAAVGELLDDLLGTDAGLGALRERIRSRSAGNPFFLEEIALSLIESGVLAGTRGRYRLTRPIDTVGIPDTVYVVLAARIDRLSERDKTVLEAASVVGKSFPEPILRRVANIPELDLLASLGALRQAEFVYEEAVDPETVYAFKHPLTQEVAYKTQLVERRKQAHAAVACAIEELYPDKLDERAALVAHHWEAAGDVLRAARWHRRAAQWAGLSDPREGLRHWRRVRELAPGVEDVSERTELTLQACHHLLALGWRMGGSEAEAAAVFEEGRALIERAGDRRALAMLVGTYGLVRANVGGSALDYVRYGEEGARIAAECDDPALRAALGVLAAYGHGHAGDGRAVLEWSARVLEEVGSDNALGKEILGFSPRAAVFTIRALALTYLGRLEEAWRQIREAERVAEESRELEVLGWVHVGRAYLAYTCGGTESVLEHGRRSLEIAEKLDNESSRAYAYSALGTAYLMDAQAAAARDALRESVAIARDRRTVRALTPQVLAVLAEAYLALGERTEALATAREAIDLGSAGGCRYFEAHAQLALAGALLATDGVVPRAEIESALERAERMVESIEGRSLSPRILEMRGRVAAALGDAPASDRALRQALELYRAIGATGHAERLARELGA